MKFEIVFIANSPTEKEKKHLKKFEETITNCIVIEIERETLYSSWNRGIKAARGNAICFWNVDDLRFGRALINGYAEIKKGTDIIYFSFLIKKKHKYYKWLPVPKFSIVFPLKFDRALFRSGMFCGPFFMFSRNAIEKIGYFDEQFNIVGDMEFCNRAADNGLEFVRSFTLAGFYIKNGNTLSANKQTEVLHKVENEVVYKRYKITYKYQELNSEGLNLLKKYKI